MSTINTDSNIIDLVEMKSEINPRNSPESEELLIKTNNKGKIKENTDYESRPPLTKENSSTSMSFNVKTDTDNQFACSISNKGKGVQKVFSEQASSIVSDIEGDPDNLSITTSIITDTSDTNNKSPHKSPSQSLRNKRFSYNSPSTSTSHQWNTASSSNINNTNINLNTTANNNNNNNININNINSNINNNGSNNRPPLHTLPLSGSFAELINLTNNAAQALALNNNSNTNQNNGNNDTYPSPSSRHASFSSNLQQNFQRLGLSENINIETVDPSSSSIGENDNRPSQVGPGETAWFLFRTYAILKFLWSFVFTVAFFIQFIIKWNKSCDERIFYYSIAFAAVFVVQAISSLLLIIYLPSSITRYTNVVRRRVVISNRAWKITALSFVCEILMVIIGAILLFNKSPSCSIYNENTSYVTITKTIVVTVLCIYTSLCFPFFILPCGCTFKLLPEYKGISEKVLKRFNSILYNPTEEVDEENAPTCSICMEAYTPGTRIKRLPCNHEFHPECITQWLETNNSCPICRKIFK